MSARIGMTQFEYREELELRVDQLATALENALELLEAAYDANTARLDHASLDPVPTMDECRAALRRVGR